jgi:GT2 family glycosyltransferase
MPEVYAIVVTWNGADHVAKCLESLQRSTVPVKIIMVDNASSDQTLHITDRICPEANIIRLQRNLGFGRANNIGIKHAYEQHAKYVFLINQDAYIEQSVIERLLEVHRLNPSFGILSPLHLDETGKNLDTLFCEHLSKALSKREFLSDLFLNKQLADIYSVEFLNAAFWLLSRECIEKVGLFNPAFEHYGEDREYADRVKFFGLHIGFVPLLKAYHARIQNKLGYATTIQRYLNQERMLIRYKLSRKVPNTAFNILSAISRATLASYYGKGSPLTDTIIKIKLLVFLFSCLFKTLQNKKIAYRGGLCFFNCAEADSRRYLLSMHC